jgi:hypothetical protein
MKYLFVGGPKHGETIDVRDNQPTVVAPLMPDIRASYYGLPLDTWPTIQTVEYFRRDIGTDRIVYVAARVR